MICVVSHDAGGAEILASYIAHNKLESLYVLSGPAISIFENRFGPIKLHSLENAILQCEKVVCGTSWQSDLEWNALRLARLHDKRSVAYLDHWCHYRERFVRSQDEQLPDEIWVGDEYAKIIAESIFFTTPIKLVPNEYFIDIKNKFIDLDQAKNRVVDESDDVSILFVCEPLSEHGLLEYGDALHWGYTEFDALRYFFKHIDSVISGRLKDIILRPHPSEPPDKYNLVCTQFNLPISIGGKKPLIEEIASCDVVVGCESMAMIVALLVGKRVISCIPPEGGRYSLPHKEIENLREKINLCTKK